MQLFTVQLYGCHYYVYLNNNNNRIEDMNERYFLGVKKNNKKAFQACFNKTKQ